MHAVERPDGVEIRWEERGSGPLVVIVHQILWSYPQVYAELIGDLARDHRVVTYDARGCGASTRVGPYDAETDAGDLLAVTEAAGGQARSLACWASRARTWAAVSFGSTLRSRAATPATCGDAIDVPSRIL